MPAARAPRTVGGKDVAVGCGGRLGLLFQPRWSAERSRHGAPPCQGDVAFDRGVVFLAALEAVVLGDGSRFADLFTDDVRFSSPHLSVETLGAVQRALASPEDSLTDIEIVVLAIDAIEDKVIAEWRLEALFSHPVLFDDRLLVEPTGEIVHLLGASVAEFREHRISSFRHYFDDSELLSGVPGSPSHLRWRSDR
jgi:hypothetical protein